MTFDAVEEKTLLKNIVGKRENAGKPAYSPFSHNVFYTMADKNNVLTNFICRLLMLSI